ncbi:cytochrome P450 [Cryptosporangium aurantiacum]|uniref:Cytochrome P450 n=1 Tax=Cryptosporangium aurantiacum TaxID=134849 RepID=A0A1M7R501_9ACTN|nr:cytochrome P450 [Cryptosporangium aurantiacum]SHN40116.1 Cytochrome P450 [Cryptosporangium aurantiacum]
MGRELAELPRIEWRPEYAEDPVPHFVRGYETVGPLFGLNVPNANPGMVFLIGAEANELVLKDVDTFQWGPVYAPVRKVWGEEALVALDGPPHRSWRKTMQPGVTGGALMRQFGMMREVIAKHLDGWADRAVAVDDALRHMIFEVAARAFCGITDVGLMREFTTEYERMMAAGTDPMVDASFGMDGEAGARVRGMLRPLIASARDRGTQDNVLEVLATTADETGAPLDPEAIAAQVLVLMLAGHETTASVSSFLLWLLGAHPEQSQRVREEIDTLPDETSVGILRRSPYLNDVLMETERLYPPLPIIGRAVSRDVEFAGFTIPAGTFIQLSPAATHRLPELFADPDMFDPDRFAEPRAEHRRHRYALIGFAGGPRVCLGMPFAKVEMGELLVQVYRRFDFTAVNQNPPRIHRGQTAVPGEPIEITFTTRAPSLVA